MSNANAGHTLAACPGYAPDFQAMGDCRNCGHTPEAHGNATPRAVTGGVVNIDYTNYRGERGVRRILPLYLSFGSNQWHPEPQWLLWAHDLDKDQERVFAVKDIHGWTPAIGGANV